jgi:hypothetical protein
MTALSNWGRWGADDELGTLNLVTAERVAAAAALVTAGRRVSCAWPVDPGVPDVYGSPQRLMLMGGAGPRPSRQRQAWSRTRTPASSSTSAWPFTG